MTPADVSYIANIGRAIPLAQCAVCFVCAGILLAAPGKRRARYIIIALMLTLSLSYIPAICGIATGEYHLAASRILNPYVLCATNVFVFILSLYPIEVIRPGWLTARRLTLLAMPMAICYILYFSLSAILPGHSVTELASIVDMKENMALFNVWGRFILLADIITYIIGIILFTAKYSRPYAEWCEENFSSTEGLSISWLHRFLYATLVLAILFSITLMTTKPLPLVIFHLYLIACVMALTVKSAFQSNAYPDDFFKKGMDELTARNESAAKERFALNRPIPGDPFYKPEEDNHGAHSHATHLSSSSSQQHQGDEASCATRHHDASAASPHPADEREGFDDNITVLANQIREWFDAEKPYCKPGFQLSDVGERIPVCRTYLSRIFNEGLNASFSNVVREYRLRDAEKMLLSRPDLPVSEIAAMCGFSNPATFNRTFSQHHSGMTPGKYRAAHTIDATTASD